MELVACTMGEARSSFCNKVSLVLRVTHHEERLVQRPISSLQRNIRLGRQTPWMYSYCLLDQDYFAPRSCEDQAMMGIGWRIRGKSRWRVNPERGDSRNNGRPSLVWGWGKDLEFREVTLAKIDNSVRYDGNNNEPPLFAGGNRFIGRAESTLNTTIVATMKTHGLGTPETTS